ncbi:MAG: hypothetical protein WBA74_17140 [Cyclobacteriaceae bacterium]
MNQNIQKSNGKITGTKEFEYFGVPNEPGEYDMADYFSWVFFNTSTDSYDTLVSDVKLIVKGESKKNQFIMANDLGSFYDRLEFEENELSAIDKTDYFVLLVNVLIVIMIVVGVVFLIKSRKTAKEV